MLIKPPNINSSDIKAFFTTRTFNEENVHIDEALSEGLGISKDNIYLPIQKHTDIVHIIRSGTEQVVADAVVTDRGNILIGILVADCVPVLMYDRKNGVIGAVHAGWRGTAAQILIKTIRKMQTDFFCLTKDILVAIGPSIRQCSYEVDAKVKTDVKRATGEGNYYIQQDSRYFVDLSTANRIQALSTGILNKNIWQSDECTFCNPDIYYSYRYSKGSTGRQGAFIGMW